MKETEEDFIAPDMRLAVKPEMVGTFQDIRQPLLTRLMRLANVQEDRAAKMLIIEAHDRLQGVTLGQVRVDAARSVETKYFLEKQAWETSLRAEISQLETRLSAIRGRTLWQRIKVVFAGEK